MNEGNGFPNELVFNAGCLVRSRDEELHMRIMGQPACVCVRKPGGTRDFRTLRQGPLSPLSLRQGAGCSSFNRLESSAPGDEPLLPRTWCLSLT